MFAVLGRRWVLVSLFFVGLNLAGWWWLARRVDPTLRAFRVEYATPTGEAPVDTEVVLKFSHPMAAPEQVGQPVELGAAVKLEPAVALRCQWRDASTLVVHPTARLTWATPYTLTITPALRGLGGVGFKREQVFHFNTPPVVWKELRQMSFKPGEAVAGTAVFNQVVDVATLPKNLTVTCKPDKPLTLDVQGVRNSVEARLLISGPLAPGDKLTLRLAKGVRGTEGTLATTEVQEFELCTVNELRLTEAYTYAQSEVLLRSSQELDLATAKDFITIQPPVAVTISRAWSGARLEGAFAAGKTYTLTFKPGLLATNGAVLVKEVTHSVTMPDLHPAATFVASGMYLSATGSRTLEVSAVNLSQVRVAVERVFPNNVLHDYREAETSDAAPADFGRELCAKTLPVVGTYNQPQTLRLPVGEWLGPGARGAYRVHLEAKGERSHYATGDAKLILVSDLGASVKVGTDSILVWVNSLSAAQPVAGAQVQVLTRQNQLLASLPTDAAGVAWVRDLHWSTEEPPYAVLITAGDDLTLLPLERGALTLADADIKGRPFRRHGYEACVYTDRGLYRPGETLHAAALLRTVEQTAPPAVPLRFELLAPDGRRAHFTLATASEEGLATADFTLPSEAMTGPYELQVSLPDGEKGQLLGEARVQVEEFVPDRLKVALTKLPAGRLTAGQPLALTVAAQHLFGAPAVGLKVTLEATVAPADFTPKGWDGYHFTDRTQTPKPLRRPQGDRQLDAQGEAQYELALPPVNLGGSSGLLTLQASVLEVGGRAVTATLSRPYDAYPCYVGLHAPTTPRTADGMVTVPVACVSPDGQAAPTTALTATLARVDYDWLQARDDEGRWRYHETRREHEIQTLPVTLTAGRGVVRVHLDQWAEYVLHISDPTGGASASLALDGWGAERKPRDPTHPETLELSLAQPTYQAGDTAQVRYKVPFTGRALATLENDQVLWTQAVDLTSTTGELAVPITAACRPNAYFSLTVLRPADNHGQALPRRALGVLAVPVAPAVAPLEVALTTPATVRPGAMCEVSLQVCDAAGHGVPARCTVAAVDEGILRVIDFHHPDPVAFFAAQRGLGVVTSDLYSLVLPEPSQAQAAADSTPGGDGDETDQRKRFLIPVSVARAAPAVWWQGAVQTEADGHATLRVPVPAEFTGAWRLMVVAATSTSMGATVAPVLVKQPLLLALSGPRFLAPGDRCEVAITVRNTSDSAGTVAVQVAATGLTLTGAAPAPVTVAANGEATLWVPVSAPATAGAASLVVTATMGEEHAAQTLALPVRPPSAPQLVTGYGQVAAGGPATITLPGGWLAGTAKATVCFASEPQLQLGGSLRYLLDYPNGCLEQTSSRVFPLLYLQNLAARTEPKLASDEHLAAYVRAGVARVLSMQLADGAFAMWPGDSAAAPWYGIYATHLLVEARRAGYEVPDAAYEAALKHLSEVTGQGDHLMYAQAVLALAGRPNRAAVHALQARHAELSPTANYLLASTLGLLRERTAAAQVLDQTTAPPPDAPRPPDSGPWSSATAARALQLSAWLQVRPAAPQTAALAHELELSLGQGRWHNTHEHALALMALGKFMRAQRHEPGEWQATVSQDGHPLATFAQDQPQRLTPPVDGHAVTVDLKGSGRAYYTWTVDGVPAAADTAVADHDLTVRRRYLNTAGKELPGGVTHPGDLVVVELTLSTPTPTTDLVLCDLLPAGLEVENARLSTRADLPWIGSDSPAARHVDVRDDRVLIYADVSGQKAVYRYLARAVTVGQFVAPAVTAEAMYEPARNSRGGASRLEVRRGD